MMFGGRGNGDHDDCAGIIHDAIDAGVNFVDTADVYSDGESEEIVGKALEGRRDDVVLATKVHWEMGPGQNDHGNSRLWITREVENSLRRLRTDHIDLYQIHRPEPETDIEETLGVLTDLQRAGKIRYFGSSTFSGWQILEAQWVADLAKIAADAGSSMTHLAIDFALTHPAVTSAIIGPRTHDQLTDLLAGADLRLDADILDAIDRLVAPGTVVDESDRGFEPWWL